MNMNMNKTEIFTGFTKLHLQLEKSVKKIQAASESLENGDIDGHSYFFEPKEMEDILHSLSSVTKYLEGSIDLLEGLNE